MNNNDNNLNKAEVLKAPPSEGLGRRYWKGIDELSNDAEFVRLKNNEFFEHLPIDKVISKKASDSFAHPRRDFLKFLGFGLAAATLASCEAPVIKTIPYLIKPEEITPGVSNWYASSFWDGYDYCSIVVKTREGRPIKIEGNTLSSVTKGGVNARVQASVLSLYDKTRLTGPTDGGKVTSWSNVDSTIKSKLDAIAAKKGNIRILTSTIISPSTKAILAEFISKYPTTKVVTYDAISFSGMLQANKESFGEAVLPTYHFEKANTIVSFGADFLVNWLSPVEFAKQYAETRKLDKGKKNMSRHIQFEATLSVTGSNADKRVMLKPSQHGAAVAALYNAIAKGTGASGISGSSVGDLQKDIDETAKELLKNKGKAFVISRSNNAAIQNLVNGINVMLGSYGNTIDLDNASMLRQGNDADLKTLLDQMGKGEVSALFVYNSNPCYTLANTEAFNPAGAGLKKVELSVSFADRMDETASNCQYVCPDHHPLESWGDAEPRKNSFSFTQPTIAPLFSTRQVQETLLVWMGDKSTYHDYLQEYWHKNFKDQSSTIFTNTWNKMLQDGAWDGPTASGKTYSSSSANLSSAASAISSMKGGDGMELVLYEKTGLGNGSQANNPWLQELPDPVSKITWDNYLCVAPKDARDKGWKTGNVVSIKANGNELKVPVLIQPGQAPGTCALAFGYGRTKAGKVADNLGKNAYALTAMGDSGLVYFGAAVITKTTDDDYQFAATQQHHTMMGRAIVKETILEEYIKNPNSGNKEEKIEERIGKELKQKHPEDVNLWNDHALPNHHWGMAIDLNSCIGCGACVIACQAENNVPVVGKDEVKRSREMHWIRIDRYYSSDADPKEGQEHQDLSAMEFPSDNPKVVFQPVMCQHCNHAPCETVCPVIATNHSSEGLNQMIYNRCVGTRYCENNCPYKVRRFNWFRYADNAKFDFNENNDLGKMVLNPDVVVRSRGVMEKCSMCVQRLQEGKLIAKKAGRPVKDGEIKTACMQTCPTNAIVFGDYNNKDSQLLSLWKPEERSYHLLAELDVQPNVFYQTKVRNVSAEEHEPVMAGEKKEG